MRVSSRVQSGRTVTRLRETAGVSSGVVASSTLSALRATVSPFLSMSRGIMDCSPLRSRRGPRAACMSVAVNGNGRALGGRASDVGTNAIHHRGRRQTLASRLMNKRSRAFDEGPARERR